MATSFLHSKLHLSSHKFGLAVLLLYYIHIFQMQEATVALKNNIWSNLKSHFDQYKNQKGQFAIQNLDAFIVDILKEESRSERDYVLKNLFKVDVDNSGAVSFDELGNFLFKRHCGEMSLQREHRAGRISHGSEYKLNLKEFVHLINLAYSFLKVTYSEEVGQFIFDTVDTDHDGFITYPQYFQVIEQYVCKSQEESKDQNKEPKEPKVGEKGPERFSKLRKEIWERLRKFYEAYVQGRQLDANDTELRALLLAIVPDLSENQITKILTGLRGLPWKTISFEVFAENFIYLIAEVGLSRFASNRQPAKRTLTKEQFALLIKNTFSFLKIGSFKNSILFKIFERIDKDHDGLITYDEYLDWVKRFLAVQHYYGDEFYVEEDDDILNPSSSFEIIEVEPFKRFTFPDYTFAKQVRARVWELLIPYDADKNEEFSEAQIKAALVGLLMENPLELYYVTKNVFRYDRNNDGEVSYHQLTNFCTETHFGQMSIQRLHRQKFYKEGAKRIMSRDEFGKTINKTLKFIQMEASEELLDGWFQIIDLDKDGWISYEVYFQFLKYYFGGASIAALETINIKPPKRKDEGPGTLSEDQKFLFALKDLNPFERFSRIIIDQLKSIFFRYDYNKNQVFEADEVRDILEKVFELDSSELAYILMKYFSVDAETEGAMTFEELISLILSIYFVEIIFKRRSGSGNAKHWVNLKISLQDFFSLFGEHCFFIKIRPSKEDLTYIFNELDTDHDGFITFNQYADFVKKYLGNGLDLSSSKYSSSDLTGVSEQELKFVQAIWDQLKKYFDKYDTGKKGYLEEGELKSFAIEVLQETTERELNYIFWNLFRVDTDTNMQVDFYQFASFILNHAGEISLQRFHRQQTAGKVALDSTEFYTVISNGYSFLSSLPKEKDVINSIFNRIRGEKPEVGYAGLLNWVHRALAAKYKKK